MAMRISGLASGLDIDSMIADLMKAERTKVDALKQKQTVLEWKQSDYRAINTSLVSLRNSTFNMKLQGTFSAKKAESSNESAATATASVSAAAGTYAVTVTSLASGVTKGSQEALADEKNADGTTKTLQEQFPTLADSDLLVIEGKLEPDGVTRSTYSFNIDTRNATIYDLVSEINEQSSDLGIKASYDAVNNRFFLTTAGTGADYGINVLTDSAGLLSDAAGDGSGVLKMSMQTGTLYQGQNAQFSFGDVTNMESPTNTATVNGITLNLKELGTANITVKSDTDAIYDSIKSFIDQYNTTLKLMNAELSEERDRDYLPLTDEERESLTDEQEEQWEAKAKSGQLRSDPLISRLVWKMRGTMSSTVPGITAVDVDGAQVTHNSLSSIGIVTGQWVEGGTEGGVLTLKNDGEDLREAIESDPDGVMKLFTDTDNGIAQTLYTQLDGAIDDIIEKAGSASTTNIYDDSELGRKINDYDDKIDDMEKYLEDLEDRYYKRFTALEEAINKYNSQSAYLTQMFASSYDS